MGTGAFLFASNFSKDLGLTGLALIGPFAFVMCIVIRVIQECRFKRRTGSWFKKENSRIMTKDGKYVWTTLIPLFANVLTNFGYLLVISIGWKLAKACGIN